MLTPAFFGTVSLVVGIVGYLPYVWGIWRRRVKPHPLSWLTWGVITSIAAAAQWSGGAGGAALWVMVSTIIFHFLFAFVGFVIDKSRADGYVPRTVSYLVPKDSEVVNDSIEVSCAIFRNIWCMWDIKLIVLLVLLSLGIYKSKVFEGFPAAISRRNSF